MFSSNQPMVAFWWLLHTSSLPSTQNAISIILTSDPSTTPCGKTRVPLDGDGHVVLSEIQLDDEEIFNFTVRQTSTVLATTRKDSVRDLLT